MPACCLQLWTSGASSWWKGTKGVGNAVCFGVLRLRVSMKLRRFAQDDERGWLLGSL
jgi:hypothetical protein